MIKKIVIRDVASYDHDGVTFDNLARVNFIYGGNGTGKTTVSRVLESPDTYMTCEVEWMGEPMCVLAYNKDFRKRNFKESIPGVFALGAKGVSSDSELAELRRKRVELGNETKRVKERVDEVKKRIEVENKRLTDNLWNYYGRRPLFKVACSGLNEISFKNRIKTLVKQGERGSGISYNYLYDLFQECYSKEKPAVDKRELLNEAMWKYMAGECSSEIDFNHEILDRLDEDLAYWDKEYRRAMRVYKKTLASIEDKEKELTSVLPAIDSINRMLEQSHFTGFSIQPSPAYPNYYQIQRSDGSFVNDTLSEGEANFIAFLYYYQLVMGNNLDYDIGTRRVLVIDDPMSSLDSEVMMLVGTMVRELIDVEGIEQVFVLTHNMDFLKQVAPRQRRKDTHYWRLMKEEMVSKVLDCGEDKPVRSGYELLWEELHEVRNILDTTRLQNLMRSIIETYFVKYGGYNKRRLYEGEYLATPEDRTAMQAFCKWLDDGSHGPADDLYASDSLMTNRHHMEDFKRFFALMGQGQHFEMMMRVE